MSTKKIPFKVGGMSCSFCTRSIEKAYRQMDGVQNVSVSLGHEGAVVTCPRPGIPTSWARFWGA